MRVTVDISEQDFALLRQFTGKETAVDCLQVALADWIRIREQLDALDHVTGIGWEADLDEMRNNWSAPAAE